MRQRKSVALLPQVDATVDRLAAKLGVSANRFLEDAARFYIAAHDRRHPDGTICVEIEGRTYWIGGV